MDRPKRAGRKRDVETDSAIEAALRGGMTPTQVIERVKGAKQTKVYEINRRLAAEERAS